MVIDLLQKCVTQSSYARRRVERYRFLSFRAYLRMVQCKTAVDGEDLEGLFIMLRENVVEFVYHLDDTDDPRRQSRSPNNHVNTIKCMANNACVEEWRAAG